MQWRSSWIARGLRLDAYRARKSGKIKRFRSFWAHPALPKRQQKAQKFDLHWHSTFHSVAFHYLFNDFFFKECFRRRCKGKQSPVLRLLLRKMWAQSDFCDERKTNRKVNYLVPLSTWILNVRFERSEKFHLKLRRLVSVVTVGGGNKNSDFRAERGGKLFN